MITASHNPAPENGVKIIDCTGLMLEQSLEPLSELLINSPDLSTLPEVLAKLGLTLADLDTIPSTVLLGHDTRVSSPALAQAVMYLAKDDACVP